MNCYIKYLIPNKFKRYSILLLVSLLLVCCSKDENSIDNLLKDNNRIRIKASIIGTRASTGSNYTTKFEVGDAIGVFIVRGNTLKETKADNYIHNCKFTFDGSEWNSETILYYPDDVEEISIYAYYPYRSGEDIDPTNMEVIVDADQNTSGEANDFMTASKNNVTKNIVPIELPFTHRLSLVQIKITGEGEGAELNNNLLEVKLLKCNTATKFNLAGNAPSSNEEYKDISMMKVNDEYIYRAWVPAQEIPNGENIFSFTQRKSSFYYKKTGTKFDTNHASIFEITLDAKLEADHIYNIGDVYPYKGFPLGVVFSFDDYEDSGTKGKIIAFDETSIEWGLASSWCLSYGDLWYLPNFDEITDVLEVLKGYPKMLATLLSYDSEMSGRYWSSVEYGANKARYGDSESKQTGIEAKSESLNVRAVRQFPK